MMTQSDIEILEQEQTRKAINENMAFDPAKIALNKHIANASLVASQVKYLQRARAKLPSYFAAECILPALSFEQSSSEECAANKHYSGELCIDLTCGLGVDTLYLSKQFRQVISVERDPMLAHIARVNFERLGVENVRVENCSAEQFIAAFDAHADLIYVDPDRRGADNRKLLLLEECSPNVMAMLTVLTTKSDRIVVKNSPLFDVDEAFRLFGNQASVEVVSLGGECKEVLIEIGTDKQNIAENNSSLEDNHNHMPQIRVTALGLGCEIFEREKPHITRIGKVLEMSYKYLIVPDVALLKARRAVEYLNRFEDIYIESDNGYGLSNTPHTTLMARIYEIESFETYNPKQLKRQLKDSKTANIDILKREFPESTAEIAKKLGVGQGGRIKIAFTTFQNHRYAVRIK